MSRADRQMRRARRLLAAYAARFGASAACGVPATFADGVHVLKMTTAEQARASGCRLSPDGADFAAAVAAAQFVYEDDPARLQLWWLAHLLGVLHRADPGVEFLPDWNDVDAHTAYAVYVRTGWAVGYRIVHDQDGDGLFEVVGNHFVVPRFRRQGIATEMHKALPGRVAPRPYTASGLAWGEAVCPEILVEPDDVMSNDATMTHVATLSRTLAGSADGIVTLRVTEHEWGAMVDAAHVYLAWFTHPSAANVCAIRAGQVVGFALVSDSDGDGSPDVLSFVWVADDHRRNGVGRELVAAAREQFPIAHVQGPLSPEGEALRAVSAPDLPVAA